MTGLEQAQLDATFWQLTLQQRDACLWRLHDYRQRRHVIRQEQLDRRQAFAILATVAALTAFTAAFVVTAVR